jgi:transposase InsO family protein
MHTLSERSPRFGYRKLYSLVKAEQWRVNRETVRRIRKHEGLQVIKPACTRRPMGTSTTTPTRAAHPKQVWSYDCVQDETPEGRRLKYLTSIDAYTRAGLERSCARSITAADVVQVRRRLLAQPGAPRYVKSDNGPECIAQRVTPWLRAPHVKTHFLAPGSPWQNGHTESFHGVFRAGCLHRWLFTSVQEAQRIIGHWLEAYKHERPHGALDGLTPRAFAAQCSDSSLGRAA